MAINNDEYEENFCEYEEGDIYAEGFGVVPAMPMNDARLSIGAKAVYAFMCVRAHDAPAHRKDTQASLNPCFQISAEEYERYINELIAYGYIRRRANGGLVLAAFVSRANGGEA